MSRRAHWDEIYETRAADEVSWYEAVPATSLRLISEAMKDGAESVIDIGGGASSLVDHLLDLGLRRVAVLDISEAGLVESKRRLGERAHDVEWIVGDVTMIESVGSLDVWHDRAVFHFLTAEADRRHYVGIAERTLPSGGTAIIATFAPDGPERCSGLDVRRYDFGQLADQFGASFEFIDGERHLHDTPSGATQSFQYSTFKRS